MIALEISVNGRKVEVTERTRRMVLLVLASSQQASQYDTGILELHFTGRRRQGVSAVLRPRIVICDERG
jgi:hypothetical protein